MSRADERMLIKDLRSEKETYQLEFLKAHDGVRAAQRGIKRLKRKLETRDAYVAAAEKLFRFIEVESIEGGRFSTSSLLKDFQEARQHLGLVKKPRPEGK